MKNRLLNCRSIAARLMLCATMFLCSYADIAAPSVSAARRITAQVSAPRIAGWTRVRTRHFVVIGDAPAESVNRIAAHLETVRAALIHLLPAHYFAAHAPSIVIVFRDESSYAPFKPPHRDRRAPDIAGYFQAGADGDHITLHAGHADESTTLRVAAHEYTHELFRRGNPRAPLWFREGIADYYGSLRVVAPDRIRIGGRLDSRVASLRGDAQVDLRTLLAVDVNSPEYNDQGSTALFYAASWALVHQMMSDPVRQARLARYLELIDAGEPHDTALHRAFAADYATLEADLRGYIRRARYREQIIRLASPLATHAAPANAPLAEAEAAAYLSDLLLAIDREDEADAYLARAVELDPALARVRVSLGILRLRQSRIDEALVHLEHALALAPDDARARFAYADALRRDTSEADSTLSGYDERTGLLRHNLREAIRLAPDSPHAYRLLAEVELERGDDTDIMIALIDKALSLTSDTEPIDRRRTSPNDARTFASRDHLRDELLLLLARARVLIGDHHAARSVLENFADRRVAFTVRDRATQLSEEITKREQDAARRLATNDPTLPESAWLPRVLPCDLPLAAPHRKPLRFAGDQVCGRLTAIACDAADGGVLLIVETGDHRSLRLHAPDLKRIRFVTYTTEARTRTSCGIQSSTPPVLVTYRAIDRSGTADAASPADGEAVAVEFVPPEWSSRAAQP